MFRVVIHFIVVSGLAGGLSIPTKAFAEEKSSSPSHNTGGSTTADADKPSVKDQLKELKDLADQDPNSVDTDKLDKLEGELNKHEQEKTMTEEEIKESREKIAEIRKSKGDKSGDGTTAGGDGAKDSGTGSKSADASSKASTESAASASTSGISSSTDNLRTDLSGGNLASSPWGTMAATMLPRIQSDTGEKLSPQATAAPPVNRVTTSIPQTVSSNSASEQRPNPQPAASAGAGAGAAAGAAVAAQPAPNVSNAVVSNNVAPTNALTEEKTFFNESQAPANNNVSNVATSVAEVERPAATAAPVAPSTASSGPVPTSAPVATNAGSTTSIPKAINATSGDSTVRTVETPTQIEVTSNFTLNDPKPSPNSASTASDPIVVTASQTGSGEAVPRTMGTSSDTYRNGVQPTQTTASDNIVNRTASQWAEGKAVAAVEEPRQVAPDFFEQSAPSLNEMTQKKAFNPPVEEELKLTRGLRESKLKDPTSLATLAARAMQSTAEEVVIQGALGLINTK